MAKKTSDTETTENTSAAKSLTLADVQAYMEKNNVNVAFYRQRKGEGIRVSVNTRKAEGRPGARLASEASPDINKAMAKAIREANRELES